MSFSEIDRLLQANTSHRSIPPNPTNQTQRKPATFHLSYGLRHSLNTAHLPPPSVVGPDGPKPPPKRKSFRKKSSAQEVLARCEQVLAVFYGVSGGSGVDGTPAYVWDS